MASKRSTVLRTLRQAVAIVALQILEQDTCQKWGGIFKFATAAVAGMKAIASAWVHKRRSTAGDHRRGVAFAAGGLCVSAVANNCVSIAGALCLLSAIATAAAAHAPSKWFLARSLAALLDADVRYAKLSRRLSQQPHSREEEEAAWRATHKDVARRVAPFLTDVHETPPLAPVLAATSAVSGFFPDSAASVPQLFPEAGLHITLAWPPLAASRVPTVSPPDPPASTPSETPEALTDRHSPPSSAFTEDGERVAVRAPSPPPLLRRTVQPENLATCDSAYDLYGPFQTGVASAAGHESATQLPAQPACESIPSRLWPGEHPHRPASASPHCADGGKWLADPARNQRLLRSRTCHARAAAEGLTLYGAGDHEHELSPTAAPRPHLSPLYLARRAAVLLTLFAPFLCIGAALLLFALCAQALSGALRASEIEAAAARTAAARDAAAAEAAVAFTDDDDTAARAAAQRAAAGASAASHDWSSRSRRAAWKLLLFGCQNAGAAFIKWAQWAASRPDVFPPDLCAVLAGLHDQAPVHSWAASERLLQEAFGCDPSALFLALERTPIASGSIAQVYRGLLPAVPGCLPQMVAVKIRHPDVVACLTADFTLLRALAAAAELVPGLRGIGIAESVSQFSSTMTAQADLRVEAAHLERFCNSFDAVSSHVRTPAPWVELVTEAVIVETFENGSSVSRFIREPSPLNTQIVARGIDAYLRMLLLNNFVHSDMHPGNILIEQEDPGDAHKFCIKILDCGLAEELTPEVRVKFVSFLHAIGAGRGRRAAELLLSWASVQNCRDPAAFADAMDALFSRRCNVCAANGIDLDAVIKHILLIARQTGLGIDGKYVTLLLGVLIIVGFGQGLDPDLNLMDAAIPCLLTFNLTGRLVGRLYS